MTVLAWHFTAGDTLRDGRPIPDIGVRLEHDGPLVLGESGLYASRRLLDALKYAPGSRLHRVECSGEMLEDATKLCCRARCILWSLDAKPVLRDFARRVALDVAHFWEMPDIVRRYLETGDESTRAAAGAFAGAASGAFAGAASGAAARAAWAAAWPAAWDAAREAARAAARDATWDAARAAARDAAWGTAWAADRDAAWGTAWDTAWDTAWAKYDVWLTEMVVAQLRGRLR